MEKNNGFDKGNLRNAIDAIVEFLNLERIESPYDLRRRDGMKVEKEKGVVRVRALNSGETKIAATIMYHVLGDYEPILEAIVDEGFEGGSVVFRCNERLGNSGYYLLGINQGTFIHEKYFRSFTPTKLTKELRDLEGRL